MWRLARIATGMVATATVLAACSLVVSTEGLAGRTTTTDAGSASDGGDTEPAALDAQADVDADANTDLPFCARQTHLFCADFDDGLPAPGQTIVRGGSLLLDPDAISPPASLACSVGASASSDQSARLRADLPAVLPGVRVAFNVKLCAAPASGVIEFFKLEFDNTFEVPASPGFGDAAIVLTVEGGEHRAVRYGRTGGAGSAYNEPTAMPIAAPDVWHHYVVTTTLSKSAGTLKVEVDGNVVVDLKNVQTLAEGATGMRLVTGAYASKLPTPCIVKIDNVAVDSL